MRARDGFSSSNAAAAQRCDAACLRGFTQRHVDALTRSDPSSLPLAGFVGVLEQSGAPAILWLSVKIERGQITEAETNVARRAAGHCSRPRR